MLIAALVSLTALSTLITLVSVVLTHRLRRIAAYQRVELQRLRSTTPRWTSATDAEVQQILKRGA